MHKHLLILLAIFTGGAAFSQETIVTDRPDQTESSEVVPVKTLQIESGISLTQSWFGAAQSTVMQVPTSLFRLSLCERFEFRLVTGINANRTNFFGNTAWQYNMTDLEVGTKISIFNRESSSFKMALLGHAVIPTSGPETNNRTGLVTRILLQHDLGEEWSIGYNFGYDYSGFGDGDLAYTVAAGTSLSEKIGYYFEAYGRVEEFENFVLNADAGFTYLVKNNIQLDYSFGIGIVNERMTFHSIGCSWRMPN